MLSWSCLFKKYFLDHAPDFFDVSDFPTAPAAATVAARLWNFFEQHALDRVRGGDEDLGGFVIHGGGGLNDHSHFLCNGLSELQIVVEVAQCSGLVRFVKRGEVFAIPGLALASQSLGNRVKAG